MVAEPMFSHALDGGESLIEIEISPSKAECPRCHRVVLAAMFFREDRSGDWIAATTCHYCRMRQKIEQTKALYSAFRRAEILASDPFSGEAPRARRQDGTIRCAICGSTTYIELRPVRRGEGSGQMTVEILCWMAGHVIVERLVKRANAPKFPTSDVALDRASRRHKIREHAKKHNMIFVDRVAEVAPKPLFPDLPKTGSPHYGVKPLSLRKIVPVNDAPVPGCDERCQPLTYIDPQDINGPAYVAIFHSPLAHNSYGATEADPTIFEWDGLKIDLAVMSIFKDGVEINDRAKTPTATEWKILRMMISDAGRIVTPARILATCWPHGYSVGKTDEPAYHVVRVNMTRLRQKLDADTQRYIKNKVGVGYFMERPIRVSRAEAIR